MEPKKLLTAGIVTSVLLFIVGGSIVGIIISTTKDPKDQAIYSPKKRYNNPATCSELKTPPDTKLSSFVGPWILQEKLEFPDGRVDANTVPNRDQLSICIRTEVVTGASDREATLLTGFYLNEKLTKNFTGFLKIGDDGYWDFHMLAKDHDGVILDSVPNKYFVFIECVPQKKGNNPPDLKTLVPGSVFVYTRGDISGTDMIAIRMRVETTLRHNDETFLDFGSYCYAQ